jgi:hypothetical protein
MDFGDLNDLFCNNKLCINFKYSPGGYEAGGFQLQKFNKMFNLFFNKNKKRNLLSYRIKRAVLLEHLSPKNRDTIFLNRSKYHFTPEVIKVHFERRNKIDKQKLHAHNNGCGCLICKLTNKERSYKQELKRLNNIVKNIQYYTKLKEKVDNNATVRETYKSAGVDDLLSFFPIYITNNLPIVLPFHSQKREKAIKTLYLRKNNCTIQGPQYNILIRNIKSIEEKIIKTQKALKRLKELTHLY